MLPKEYLEQPYATHLNPIDWTMWAIVFMLETITATVVFLRRVAPRLTMFRAYLVFLIGYDIVLYILANFASYTDYWHAFWFLKGISYILQCLVTTQILNHVVRTKYHIHVALFYSAVGIVLLGVAMMKMPELPQSTPVLLFMASKADVICGFLLFLALVVCEEWPASYRLIAYGMATSLSLHALCVIGQLNDHWHHFGLVRASYGLASAATMGFWLYAVLQKDNVVQFRPKAKANAA